MVKITKKALKKTEPQVKKYTQASRVRKDNMKMDAHQHMITRLMDVYGYDYINNKNMPKDDKSRNEIKRMIDAPKPKSKNRTIGFILPENKEQN